MKKTLLLSVVASTMIMAGGDIAPVEPVVEAPVVEAATWNFTGQGVLYTQTVDGSGNESLFSDETTYAAWGVQLGATHANLAAGIGAGVEVSGIVASTGNAGFYRGGGNAGTTSGGLTKAYLTYGIGKTLIKVGRQAIPKSLSPFGYSESWQMFQNTFDAGAIINGDIEKTTLVFGYVKNTNRSVGPYANEDSFDDGAGTLADDGIYLVAASTKLITDTTLSGYFYSAPSLGNDAMGAGQFGDTTILWGDAKYSNGTFGVELQGGQVSPDNYNETSAFGVKVSGKLAGFNLSAAYSSVDEDGALPIINLATMVKSPLYTQMVLNNVGNYHSAPGSDFLKLFATTKVLGGTVKVGYGAGTNDVDATKGDFTEFDLMYVTKLTENIKVFGAYVYTDDDAYTEATATGGRPSENNFVRFWARYSF